MVESVFQVGMFMITAVIVTQVLQEGTVKSIFAVSQKIVMEGSAYPKILTLQTLCVFVLLGKQECSARQVSTNQINCVIACIPQLMDPCRRLLLK